MALEVKSKRDKRLVSKGRSQALAKARREASAGGVMDIALTAGGAYAGQKWLNGPTPMWPTIPLAYSVPLGLAVLEMVGVKLVSGKSKGMLDTFMAGAIAGEVGRRTASGQKLF